MRFMGKGGSVPPPLGQGGWVDEMDVTVWMKGVAPRPAPPPGPEGDLRHAVRLAHQEVDEALRQRVVVRPADRLDGGLNRVVVAARQQQPQRLRTPRDPRGAPAPVNRLDITWWKHPPSASRPGRKIRGGRRSILSAPRVVESSLKSPPPRFDFGQSRSGFATEETTSDRFGFFRENPRFGLEDVLAGCN